MLVRYLSARERIPGVVTPEEVAPRLGDRQPDDRASTHRWARGQLWQGRRAIWRYRWAKRRALRAVLKAREQQQRERIEQRLSATSAEDLAKGARVNATALRQGGVATASDVSRSSLEELQRLRGIGQSSAQKIKEAAAKLAQLGADDLRPPANPQKWNPGDSALVRSLSMLALITAVAPHAVALQQAVEAVRWLARATNWLVWLLSPLARKNQVQSEARKSRQEWSAQFAQSLRGVLDGLGRAQRAADEPDHAVIDEWRSSSADLLALLDQVLSQKGSAAERAILQRDLNTRLSKGLLDLIQSTTLNTERLAMKLRAYQDLGARFAVAVRRGLLGDDMGLGKTIQALAAIAHVTETEEVKHHVVVCPASLIDTWLQEIRRALVGIPGWRFHGQLRGVALDDWRDSGGILVTSFQQAEHLLTADLPTIGFVVVDEAHFVKTPTAQRTRIARALIKRGDRTLLMSGTPMENRTAEFIALADLANPQQGLQLRQQFSDGRDAHYRAADFRDAVGDIYLRRNQDEVLTELPEIIATDVRIEVGEDEILACKQALVDHNLNGARLALTSGNGERSAKIVRLKEIIGECRASQKKVLIFSQYRRVLSLCESLLGGDALVLHGDVSTGKRTEAVDVFRQTTGFSAMVMQIEVGGVGLNLQAASVVVLMEPQLKPSTEQQAIARAYRMGQTHAVVVYRLIAEGSIDERIVQLSGFKAELFDRLARRSRLADEASKHSARVRDVAEGELLDWARKKYGQEP